MRSVSPAARSTGWIVPPGVDEAEAVAREALHDEPLSTEETDAEPLLERDPDRHAAGRAEEGVLLADELAAELGEVHREDLPGVGGREGDPLAAAAGVREDGHEEALARQEPLSGAEERPHQLRPARRRGGRAVAEDGLHRDPRGHEHHRARLGDDRLARVERHLDELHLGAVDLEVDLVRPTRRGRRERRRARSGRPRELGDAPERRPAGEARPERERCAVGAAAGEARADLVSREGAHRVAADEEMPARVGHRPGSFQETGAASIAAAVLASSAAVRSGVRERRFARCAR